MKRVFSGAQPTNQIHLGNYLGALRNWVALQDGHECFYCIVNLHAITFPQDPKELAEKTRDLARAFIAAGVDPEVSTIFIQSDVVEHAELTWILNCITKVGELDRMTQFKEKGRMQRESAGVGLFDYPVLMASDVLLYQTDLVPVGEDQRQHLELTRDIALRFNRDYGETFRLPAPYISKVGARIMSLDNPLKKMSKSDESPNGVILLLDDADSVSRKFKRAVTDSGTEIRFDQDRPALMNLLTIYQLLTGKAPEEVEAHFAGKGYAQLKGELAEVTIEALAPFQKRMSEVSDDVLDRILADGRDKAKAIAVKTIGSVKENMGLVGARNLSH